VLTATAVVVGLGVLALWRDTGAPGHAGPDARPLTATVAEGASTSSSAAATYGALESHLKLQPRDGRALVFKARMDAEAGRFEMAAQGYATATRVAPRVARDPAVWVEFAEARAMAQGGRLAGEPEQSLERALSLDDRHPQALDLLGSAAWERGHHAQAAALWRRLLAQTAPDSERHGALVRAIDRAEMLAKVSLQPRS
jgi:cytochrome c-type biogenesis protein CcmH